MPYKLKELPGEPIIISTLLPPFDYNNDLRAIGEEVKIILQETSGIYYFITDTTALNHLTFNDVVFGLVAATRGAASFLLRDERLKPLFVGTSTFVRLATDSLRQKQYGGLSFRMFSSLDQALVHIRQEIATKQ